MIKGAPKRIWLQIGDDDPESFESDNFHDLADDGQVTWCADHQYDADIGYVRDDVCADLLEALEVIIRDGRLQTFEDREKCRAIARAAIAKARGE